MIAFYGIFMDDQENVTELFGPGGIYPEVQIPVRRSEVAFPVEQILQLLAVSNPIWRS
jgi:hypothetical protein